MRNEMLNNRQYRADVDQEVGQPGEAAVLAYLERKFGQDHVDHFPYGQMDVDFAVRIRGRVYFLDVETRHHRWPAGDWPYDTIHVPGRKWEMISRRTPFYYWVVRRDLARALVIRGSKILAAEIVQVGGTYEPTDEESFFDVPREQIDKYIDLEAYDGQ